MDLKEHQAKEWSQAVRLVQEAINDLKDKTDAAVIS